MYRNPFENYKFSPPPSQPPQETASCYGTFDGKNFNLYNNNKKLYQLNAMSGKRGYQCKEYQDIPNIGPIPEGTYHMYQDQRQTIDPFRALLGLSNQWGWKGSIPAWGLRRIPLVPDPTTNTYGRGGFFSHGGYEMESAGCIDTPYQTKIISNFLDKCQYDVPVYVKYPKDCW